MKYSFGFVVIALLVGDDEFHHPCGGLGPNFWLRHRHTPVNQIFRRGQSAERPAADRHGRHYFRVVFGPAGRLTALAGNPKCTARLAWQLYGAVGRDSGQWPALSVVHHRRSALGGSADQRPGGTTAGHAAERALRHEGRGRTDAQWPARFRLSDGIGQQCGQPQWRKQQCHQRRRDDRLRAPCG